MEYSVVHCGYLSLHSWQPHNSNATLTENINNKIQSATYRFWHFCPVPNFVRGAVELKKKEEMKEKLFFSSTEMAWAPCARTFLRAFLEREKEEKRVSVTLALGAGWGQLATPASDSHQDESPPRARKLAPSSQAHTGSDVMGASKQEEMRKYRPTICIFL